MSKCFRTCQVIYNLDKIKINFSFFCVSFADVDLSKSFSIDRRKLKKFFGRRNSTGSVGVMNSHALNLQASGQTVIVGHHRGFSQSSAVNSGSDPWFLQTTSHEMPPTAPARQHKRPAPQPGLILQNNVHSSSHQSLLSAASSSALSSIPQSQIPFHLPVTAVNIISCSFEFHQN